MKLIPCLRMAMAITAGLLLLGNAACGGGGGAAQNTTPPVISVSLKADKGALGPGGTAVLTATVANDSSNAGVTFSKPAGDAGTLTPTGAFTATYTAANFTQAGSVVITATSKADPSKSATQTLTLTLSITVTATEDKTDVGPGQTSTITANVANDINSAGVTFSLISGDGTLTSTGALTATYTAPAHIAADSSVQVKAVSKADTSSTPASTTVSFNQRAVTIAVTLGSATALTPLQGVVLTAATQYDGGAGVSWSLATGAAGTLTSLDSTHAAYSAPDTIAAAATENVVATSVLDNSRTQTQAVNIAPVTADPEIDSNIDTTGVWQNLVQFQNDLLRTGVGKPTTEGNCLAGAAPYAAMELGASLQPTNPNVTPSVFQSDLLIFHDTQTGHEIWRLDDDRTTETAMPGPINRQPWDANGSHFQVWSGREVPQNSGQYGCTQRNFIFNGNASQVSLAQPTDSTRTGYLQDQLGTVTGQYLPWDPTTPGKFYITDWDDTNAPFSSASPGAGLYAVDATTSNDVMTEITPLDNPSRRKEIQSYANNDGMIMVKDYNADCTGSGGGVPTSPCVEGPTYWPNIYLIATNPSDPSFGKVKFEFTAQLSAIPSLTATMNAFATQCITGSSIVSVENSCHNIGDEYHFHDIYFRRSADDSIIFNYGSRGDVGETVFFQVTPPADPLTGTYPVTAAPTVTQAYSWSGIPAGTVGGTPYYSHPAWNSDGSLVAYFGEQNFNNNNGPYAVWIRNHNSGTTLFQAGPTQGFGHSGWDGFDPKYFTYDVPGTTQDSNGYETYGLYSVDPTVNNAPLNFLMHTKKRGTSSPELLEGPAQSPDATKVMYTLPEAWVANSNRNAYVVVDHRPFPPVLSATSSGASVTLTWTPYVTHRETAGYHVYRSPQGANTFTEVDGGSLVTGTTFTDTPAAGTYDYAVTAQENSGLESNLLSNVMEVTVGGGAGTQITAQGTTGWDTSAPAPPSGLSACLGTQTGSGGNIPYIKLTWTASTSADARYYSIYYGDGAAPLATQSYLIATPPAGVSQWILWQLDPNIPPVLGMTTTDRQDNTSTLVTLKVGVPQACQ